MKQKLFSLLLAAVISLPLAGCGGNDFGTIAVIGGADGPTEVFVSGPGFSEPAQPDAREEEPAVPDMEPQEPDGGQTGDVDLYEEAAPLDEAGTYNSAEDVSLYLDFYGHLPDNYITKREARELGWSGGSVEQVAPGRAIGGDRFGNREEILPTGRTYYECDIDTIGCSSRGAKRLVYSDDGLIYYTEDHYESFTLLYGEE